MSPPNRRGIWGAANKLILTATPSLEGLPGGKEKVSIRLDKDILEWFRAQKDKGYQSRINAVLRAYVEAHKA